jgi:hypothetical protein
MDSMTRNHLSVCTCAQRTGAAAYELPQPDHLQYVSRPLAQRRNGKQYSCPSTIHQQWHSSCNASALLLLHPMAQCIMHALKGLACRARGTPACLPASHCKQCSALTLPVLHARGCASPSLLAHAEVTKYRIFFNGSKT